MPNPYESGQVVILASGATRLFGRIRELSLSTALIAFTVPHEVPRTANLEWPDGMRSEVDLSARRAQVELVVRVPIPERPPHPSDAPGKRASRKDDVRRSLRIDISIPFTLIDPRDPDAIVTGKSLNLSTGGALVVADAPLVVGREYTCQVELPDEQLQIKAKPIRRMGHNSYALRLLTSTDVSHRLMRRLFGLLRGRTAVPKPSRSNFRRS